ncbi:phage portal protein [Asticcacaulis solisilvae]|uniref:phage portal protein n=1 Tax=Asticcacaulis solisilvae TaxID=1217274 RepID=UPI003FD8CCF8
MTDDELDPGARAGVRSFSFGDAEGVLNRRDVLDYVEAYSNSRWYEPPIPRRALARVLNVSGHHRSAISVKRNLLVKTFIPSTLLDRSNFAKWVLDFLVMGDGYLERVDNLVGRPLRLEHSLALYTRRGLQPGQFFFLEHENRYDPHEFQPGSVFQLMEHDVSQEIYGVPEYISALQSAFLNEASTLFRRRYYINGAHAGFVFYVSESTMDNKDVDAIRESLRQAKGVGNFKNLFLHVPNGKKDGVQIIPISEVAAKDEFLGIKNTTRDDILAAHRVPPQLLGVVPANAGGFGDVEKAAAIFFRNEIEALQMRTLELNDWLGIEVVKYAPYDVATASPAPAA